MPPYTTTQRSDASELNEMKIIAKTKTQQRMVVVGGKNEQTPKHSIKTSGQEKWKYR